VKNHLRLRQNISTLCLGLLLVASKASSQETLGTPGTPEVPPPFVCVFEKNRPPHPEADMLFQHATWRLKKARHSTREEESLREAERLLRIAAAWGHELAACALAQWLLREQHERARAPDSVVHPVDGVEGLMRRETACGYQLMGDMLRQGRGVMKDTTASMQHIRKAAELGSPKAQFEVWAHLSREEPGKPALNTTGKEMVLCAANQGHAGAAAVVGASLRDEGKYEEALQYFQRAVQAGSEWSAGILSQAFEDRNLEGSFYLGQAADEERSRRYKKLKETLPRYHHAHITVDEINRILPLPPAQLPPWDGKLLWVKQWESNIPPPLPSEERIQHMARAKGLEATTGWPLEKTSAGAPQKKQSPLKLSEIPDSLEGQLPFVCTLEKNHSPPPHPEADKLFAHVQWHHEKSLLTNRPELHPEAERLLRIAAAWGHELAAYQLAHMLMKGRAFWERHAPDDQTLPLALAENLMRRGIPRGYFLKGLLLEAGFQHQQDAKATLQHWRKAADLGNPTAQYRLGVLLSARSAQYHIGQAMKRCAAKQGHAEAAVEVGIRLQHQKQYAEALPYFQRALKAGNQLAAQCLHLAFMEPESRWNFLGQPKNEERADRYKKLLESLRYGFAQAHPTVEEVDHILPLPPAKLPPWDGELLWVKQRQNNKPPPLPSEERIQHMARAKGLEPTTGWPMHKEAK